MRAVIVCSAHKVFCAGLDLDIVRGKRGTETKLFLERLYFALNDVQYRMGKPTIAAIDGPARAGGMTIAISCDMIIAGEAATFGYPEIDVGLIPALHFVQLPRLDRQASGVRSAVSRRFLRCLSRISHGAGQRSRAEGNRARSRASHRAAFRGKIAHRDENWPRCLHAARSMRIIAARSRTQPRVLRWWRRPRIARKALMPSSRRDRRNIPDADEWLD